jgi:hypothetical protein
MILSQHGLPYRIVLRGRFINFLSAQEKIYLLNIFILKTFLIDLPRVAKRNCFPMRFLEPQKGMTYLYCYQQTYMKLYALFSIINSRPHKLNPFANASFRKKALSVYLCANIFANGLFTTINDKVVLNSTT